MISECPPGGCDPKGSGGSGNTQFACDCVEKRFDNVWNQVVLNCVESFPGVRTWTDFKDDTHVRSTAGTDAASWNFTGKHSINFGIFCFVVGFWKTLDHFVFAGRQL